MSIAKLIDRIHKDETWWALCKIVGYGGFPFCELAAKMRPLVERHGAKKVSAALIELVQHTGWVTQLNPQARKACFSVLGPAPEQWDWYYTDALGKPLPRPDHHTEPPVIPPPQPDPILDGLTRLTATELDIKLRQCRAALRKKDTPDHQRQLAEETIPRVESEMVRRGETIPPEDKEEPKAEGKPAEEKPKKKRVKK